MVVVLLLWLLYEYKQVANLAEERVANDIRWLQQGFEESDAFLAPEHENKTHLETKLMHQSVTENNRFQRHYRSLFILEGKKSCLESVLSYLNLSPVLERQDWMVSTENCTN